MLTKNQRQSIRSLLQDARFLAVDEFLKELKEKYQNEQVKGESEFLTLWNVASREAKIEAIDNIRNGLIEAAANDD